VDPRPDEGPDDLGDDEPQALTPDDSSSGTGPSEADDSLAGRISSPSSQIPKTEGDPEVEQIASLVFARIENKLEQHLHTQMEMPSADQAADLRDRAPEIYQTWIEIARQKADTEAYVQRAQYEVPERLARTGRPWALAALLVVLGFCGYVASLGGAGLYIGGIVAAIDLVTMLGLFFGFRPEFMEQERRSKIQPKDGETKRELPPPSKDTDNDTSS
jgi:hypothetical protein